MFSGLANRVGRWTTRETTPAARQNATILQCVRFMPVRGLLEPLGGRLWAASLSLIGRMNTETVTRQETHGNPSLADVFQSKTAKSGRQVWN